MLLVFIFLFFVFILIFIFYFNRKYHSHKDNKKDNAESSVVNASTYSYTYIIEVQTNSACQSYTKSIFEDNMNNVSQHYGDKSGELSPLFSLHLNELKKFHDGEINENQVRYNLYQNTSNILSVLGYTSMSINYNNLRDNLNQYYDMFIDTYLQYKNGEYRKAKNSYYNSLIHLYIFYSTILKH